MPVRTKAPERENGDPLVYFKGTTQEAGNIGPMEIRKAFGIAGIRLNDEKQVDALKKDLSGAIAFLQHSEENRSKGALINLSTGAGVVNLKVSLTEKNNVLIHQQPAIHGVRKRVNTFDDLKGLLEEGFFGSIPNNAIVSPQRKWVTSWAAFDDEVMRIARRDRYSVELMAPPIMQVRPPEDIAERHTFEPDAFVHHATPQQILCVNVEFQNGLSKEEVEMKERFYRHALKRYEVPIHFMMDG